MNIAPMTGEINTKSIQIYQTIPTPLYFEAQKKWKKEGFRNIQEYINNLIRLDTLNQSKL